MDAVLFLQGRKGIVQAPDAALPDLGEQGALTLVLGSFADGFESLKDLTLRRVQVHLFFGDHAFLYLLRELPAELGGPLFRAGHDEALDALAESRVPREITQLVVELMDVSLCAAADRVLIHTASWSRRGGREIQLPVPATADIPGVLRRVSHWRSYEEPEVLGVHERHTIRLVLVERQQERRDVRLTPPHSLRQV